MTLQIENPGFWFGLFFFTSIVVASVLQFFEGKKLNYPVLSWLILILLGKVLFFAGIQIITYRSTDWNIVFNQFILPETHSRSLLGGFIAFIVLFLFARYVLKYDNHFLDTFTVPLLVGMAIQRLGCLFVGCCSGFICNLPWSVHYGKNSLPFLWQQEQGIINSNDPISAGVHPIALYYITACVIILILYYKFKKRWKAPGTSLLFAGTLFLLSRFFIEYLVNPAFENVGTHMYFGLKTVQWGLIIIIIPFTFLMFYREITCAKSNIYIPKEKLVFNLFLVFILMLFIWWGRNFYNFVELFILLGISIVLFGTITLRLYRKISLVNYRWIPATLFVCFVLLTSQTIVQNNDSIWKKSNYISLGHAMGNYETKYSTGCNSHEYEQKAEVSSISISSKLTKISKLERSNEFGIALAIGSNSFKEIKTNPQDMKNGSIDIFGINPYFKYDRKYFGCGVGIAFGSYNFGHQPDKESFMPEISLRVGMKNFLYFESNLNYNEPISSHFTNYNCKIGTGFGIYDGPDLSFGLGNMGHDDKYLYLVSGTYPIKNKFYLSAALGIFDNKNNYSSFSLKYRFH